MSDRYRPIRRAVIIAVGSELLTSTKVDTNSLFLTEQLDGLGVTLAYKLVVGDDQASVSQHVLRTRDEDCTDLILLTGGLGATDDDLTRAAVSQALDLQMEEHEDLVATIRSRFEERGLTMPDLNRRQALVPRGAKVLPNPHGTAPGLWIPTAGRITVLLPGPPRELQPMFTDYVRPRLTPLTRGQRVHRRIVTVAGRTESRVEELTQPIYSRWREPSPAISTTILAAPGRIELHLTTVADSDSSSSTETVSRLEEAVDELSEVLGASVVSTCGESLESVVGQLLTARHQQVAVAESCTGGLVTSRLTDIPGSSAYVHGGWIAYSNRAKMEQLGVGADLLERHGAVSEEVARAFADGARRLTRVDYGVGVTGIAGPDGGTEAKPVGTVWIAIAGPRPATRARHFRFVGERDRVRFQAAQTALDLLRRALLAENAPVDSV